MSEPDFSNVPIENWDVADIHPYPHNNKKHPPKHIEMLAASIKAHGHIDPIILDKNGVIIAGHGRFMAIQKLGRAKAMVRVLKDITETEASVLRIASNKTVSNDYDTDALSRELASLNDLGLDLSLMGFEQKELDMLIVDVGEIDTDIITDDMTSAVEQHEQDVSDKADEVAGEGVRLDKAFGFKTVPLNDQKHISRFMAEIEHETGLKGAEALTAFAKSHLKAA